MSEGKETFPIPGGDPEQNGPQHQPELGPQQAFPGSLHDAREAISSAVGREDEELQVNPLDAVDAHAGADAHEMLGKMFGDNGKKIDAQKAQQMLDALERGEHNPELTRNYAEFLKQMGADRESARGAMLEAGIEPDKADEVLGTMEFPEKSEHDDKSDEELEVLRLQEHDELQSAIRDAEQQAQKVLDHSNYPTLTDPTLKEKLENAKHNFDHYIGHKKDALKAYFRQPAKVWFKRGVKYTSVGLAALLLLFIWEMQLIGKMSKKK